jgi:uncharacterized protein (DUF2336 family)
MNAPLSFIHEIEHSIALSSGGRRAEMVRRLTDLFLVNADQYSDDEIALIDDVFVRLVVTIEESARALLAIRLGPYCKAPAGILSALACDDAIDVASPVLIQAERLDEATLVACAKTKSQEHLLAISRRKTLAEQVTDVLVERGDQQVLLSTAQNSGAKFSDNGFAILADRSDGDDLLAACVGIRADLPPQIFERLLETASLTVRAKLEAESPHARNAIDRAVSEVTAQIQAHAATGSPRYAATLEPIEALGPFERYDVGQLEAFAKARRFEETVAALAFMSDMPADVVERKVKDDHGEFLVILARAIGASWETTEIILAFSAGDSPRSPGDIERCEIAYLRLNRATAQKILSFHRTRERPGGKTH